MYFNSYDTLILYYITRKENGIIANINTKKGFILKLLNAQAGYIRCKIEGIYRKLVKKNR